MNLDNIKLFKIDDDKQERLWSSAVFVFDTSALLEFYYLPKKTRQNIYDQTFAHLKERLWTPGHVEFEFLKNQEETISKAYNDQYESIEKLIADLKPNFDQHINKKVHEISEKTKKDDKHPHLDQVYLNEIKTKIENFSKDIEEFKNKITLQVNASQTEILNTNTEDDVLEAINTYFLIGSNYSFEQIIEITKEGKHRYEYKIPPGYGDFYNKEKKGTQIFGDLIIWKQILDYAKDKRLPIIFITNDNTKDEDWCYFEKDKNENRIKAPREELIKEMYDHAGTEFWMYNLPQFLYHSRKYLKSKIPEQAIQFISQRANTNGNKGNYLKIECEQCGEIHSFHKSGFDLEFKVGESYERQMGSEIHYQELEDFDCECGNVIEITFNLWEYPIGSHNSDDIEIEGGELLESFHFTKDFYEKDYLNQFKLCEVCDGNRESAGNYIYNWRKHRLTNEFPPEHENSIHKGLIAGTCDWCNTLHTYCPLCNALNYYSDAELEENKECAGGCGLVFKFESDNAHGELSSYNLKLVDTRRGNCSICDKEFIDKSNIEICPECEEEEASY